MKPRAREPRGKYYSEYLCECTYARMHAPFRGASSRSIPTHDFTFTFAAERSFFAYTREKSLSLSLSLLSMPFSEGLNNGRAMHASRRIIQRSFPKDASTLSFKLKMNTRRGHGVFVLATFSSRILYRPVGAAGREDVRRCQRAGDAHTHTQTDTNPHCTHFRKYRNTPVRSRFVRTRETQPTQGNVRSRLFIRGCGISRGASQ